MTRPCANFSLSLNKGGGTELGPFVEVRAPDPHTYISFAGLKGNEGTIRRSRNCFTDDHPSLGVEDSFLTFLPGEGLILIEAVVK